jgi:2-keto-4-pentenoate hydratase/2-oxohepta-3-ene-1,7-dioic acid hydratase in catechol pathway
MLRTVAARLTVKSLLAANLLSGVGQNDVDERTAAKLADVTLLPPIPLLSRINGEELQRGESATLLFSFARIIAYISTGDLIAAGTPPGAGGHFDPPKRPGDSVEVECPTLGILRNTVVDEVA